MIAPAKVMETERLLAVGKLSQRKIAALVGVSRATVSAIAAGTRPDYEARRLARLDEERPPAHGEIGHGAPVVDIESHTGHGRTLPQHPHIAHHDQVRRVAHLRQRQHARRQLRTDAGGIAHRQSDHGPGRRLAHEVLPVVVDL